MRYHILQRETKRTSFLRRIDMKQRSWIVRHCTLQTTDAQLRWDRAYQALVHWSVSSTEEQSPSSIEEEHNHESRDVCSGLDLPAGSYPNHRTANPALA